MGRRRIPWTNIKPELYHPLSKPSGPTNNPKIVVYQFYYPTISKYIDSSQFTPHGKSKYGKVSIHVKRQLKSLLILIGRIIPHCTAL